MTSSTRRRFAELLAAPRPDIAEANLLIAPEADPAVDVPAALARVDHFADLAARRGGTAGDVAAVLRHAGFLGDRDDYDNPANSFLHSVLERRQGLPILLSALTIAVADRVGAPVAGIGMPGHFIVADMTGASPRYLDPFDGWREIGERRLARIVAEVAGVPLSEEHLAPVGAVAMVRRMLVNLRGSYLRRERMGDALWTLELEELSAPGEPGLRMQRRSVLMALGRLEEAERSAREELGVSADPTERAAVEQQLAAIADLRRRPSSSGQA